jgi:hypothetical protein
MQQLHDLNFVLPIFIGMFWAIVFMQSGFDKVFDWSGNLSWLEEHFKPTPLSPFVKPMLGFLTVIEVITGLISFVGVGIFIQNGNTWWITQGVILAMVAFLMLIFGQRVAKDYEGAKTIAIYFGIALLSALILI